MIHDLYTGSEIWKTYTASTSLSIAFYAITQFRRHALAGPGIGSYHIYDHCNCATSTRTAIKTVSLWAGTGK